MSTAFCHMVSETWSKISVPESAFTKSILETSCTTAENSLNCNFGQAVISSCTPSSDDNHQLVGPARRTEIPLNSGKAQPAITIPQCPTSAVVRPTTLHTSRAIFRSGDPLPRRSIPVWSSGFSDANVELTVRTSGSQCLSGRAERLRESALLHGAAVHGGAALPAVRGHFRPRDAARRILL